MQQNMRGEYRDHATIQGIDFEKAMCDSTQKLKLPFLVFILNSKTTLLKTLYVTLHEHYIHPYLGRQIRLYKPNKPKHGYKRMIMQVKNNLERFGFKVSLYEVTKWGRHSTYTNILVCNIN